MGNALSDTRTALKKGDDVVILGVADAVIEAVFPGFGGAMGVRVKTVGVDIHGKEKLFYSFVPAGWVEKRG